MQSLEKYTVSMHIHSRNSDTFNIHFLSTQDRVLPYLETFNKVASCLKIEGRESNKMFAISNLHRMPVHQWTLLFGIQIRDKISLFNFLSARLNTVMDQCYLSKAPSAVQEPKGHRRWQHPTEGTSGLGKSHPNHNRTDTQTAKVYLLIKSIKSATL